MLSWGAAAIGFSCGIPFFILLVVGRAGLSAPVAAGWSVTPAFAVGYLAVIIPVVLAALYAFVLHLVAERRG